jgi:hypothetical protein
MRHPLHPFRTHAALTALATTLAALSLGAPAGAFTQGVNGKTPSRTAAGLAQERYYASYAAPTTTPTQTDVARAQERYYSSYGTPANLPSHPTTIQIAGRDGIAPLAFILSTLGALGAGLALGLAVHRIRFRRRASATVAT